MVQGDASRRGELFGIKNLLRVSSCSKRDQSCLTERIEKRNSELEHKIRTTSKVAMSLADYELEHHEEEDETDDDPFKIGWHNELGLDNVVYSHFNNAMVGESNEEKQLSRAAKIAAVKNDDSEDDIEEITNIGKYNPGTVGDLQKQVRKNGRTIIYGSTPEDDMKSLFNDLASKTESLDPAELAEKVMRMTWTERMDLLTRHFSDDKDVVKVLKSARREYDNHGDDDKQSISNKRNFIPTKIKSDMKNNSAAETSKVKSSNMTTILPQTTPVQDHKPVIVSYSDDQPSQSSSVKPAPDGVFYKRRRRSDSNYLTNNYSREESEHVEISCKNSIDDSIDDIFPNKRVKLKDFNVKLDKSVEIESLDDIFN